jgi:hypothetical protein
MVVTWAFSFIEKTRKNKTAKALKKFISDAILVKDYLIIVFL